MSTCANGSRYIAKKEMSNAVRRTCTWRRKVCLLKDLRIRKRLEEKVIEIVDVCVLNLWGHFKDGDLGTCDDVGWKKRGGEVKEIHGGGMKK